MTTPQTHVIFGAGILGTTIAAELARTGANVRLVTRNGKGAAPGIVPETADISDPAAATHAARGADAIYFCAAPPYQDWTRSFMALQEGAIAAARATGAVLVAAENLYGYGVAGRLTEDMPLTATTRKGAIRARMSHRLFQAHAGGEIRAVAGRAADFFGPGVRMSALGDRFWPELLKGKPVSWFGDPDARHSFTYLPDFARALIALAAAPDTHGRAWHVGSPPVTTPRQLAAQAAAVAGAPAPKLRRTPRILLQLVGIAVPAAGEMVEMEYSFARGFIMAHDDWTHRFGDTATQWNTALDATIAAWREETPIVAHATA